MDTEQKIVCMIKDAYTRADFEPLFPLMTDDYEHISFWVLEVKRDKEAARDYYSGKARAIRNGGSAITGSIVRIMEAPDSVRPRHVYQDGRRYLEPECFMHRKDDGKLAVLMEQEIDNETVRTLAIPTITGDGMLRQILITEPSFYKYQILPDDEF